MNVPEKLFERFLAGNRVVFFTGRSLLDLDLDGDGNIRPIEFLLSQYAAQKYKMGTLFFDISRGARYDLSHFSNPKDADAFRHALSQAGIKLEGSDGSFERPAHERAYLLLQQLHRVLKREQPIPSLLIVFQFMEDLIGDDTGVTREVVLQLSEMIQVLAAEYALRRHEMLLVLATEFPESIGTCIARLSTVHVSNPDRNSKKAFVAALKASTLRKNAAYASGVNDDVVVNLTDNTPNSGLENVFMESAKLGKPIRETDLLAQKRQDVTRLSRGTLALVDTRRIRDVHLCGKTVQKVQALLCRWGNGLKVGSRTVPQNVLLCGAPSTSKTDLCMILGETAGVNMLQLLSTKGSLVGQTEQQTRLQWRCLRELRPNAAFVDEFTEVFPVSRDGANLDAGASAAVMAEMLTQLSDRSRAGQIMVIGTTNRPYQMGTALLSRFVVVPVISAIDEDYPAILTSLARSVEPALAEDLQNHAKIKKAARLFFEKGCSPRLMRESLVITVGIADSPLNPDLILESAQMASEVSVRDRASAEYADLYALKLTTDRRFLPWADAPKEFPLPHYLKGIVRPDGSLDQDVLNSRLDQLKPHVSL